MLATTAASGPATTIITLFPPSLTTYEEHFVVRFPPTLAASVRADLQETGLPGDLEIVFNRTACLLSCYDYYCYRHLPSRARQTAGPGQL